MESAMIRELLEKYWQAETSVEEEAMLTDYFRQDIIDAELEQYRSAFSYFDKEAIPAPSRGLSESILDKIRQEEFLGEVRNVRPLYVRGWAYAAAAILLISVGLQLTPRPVVPVRGPLATTESYAVKDTYRDPAMAMAVVQKALMTMSIKMNEGEKITRRTMGRLSKDWQKAHGK